MLELMNKIHNLDEKQIEIFTQELLDKCNSTAQKEEVVGMGFSKLNKGFIGFDTRISYGSSYHYFYRMNDFDMYCDFFKQLKYSTVSDLNGLLNEIYRYIVRYFANNENNNKKIEINILLIFYLKMRVYLMKNT